MHQHATYKKKRHAQQHSRVVVFFLWVYSFWSYIVSLFLFRVSFSSINFSEEKNKVISKIGLIKRLLRTSLPNRPCLVRDRRTDFVVGDFARCPKSIESMDWRREHSRDNLGNSDEQLYHVPYDSVRHQRITKTKFYQFAE